MKTLTETRSITVAVTGNPNTGKSTLFNALVGMRQRVGNYPGVTVEKRLGTLHHGGRQFTLVDLPGTYSLAARSGDEMIAVEVLLGRRDDLPAPDLILAVVDASNLERNLYLASQLLEISVPLVVVLTMTDVASDRGIEIDAELLSRRLGVAVVPVQAHRGQGLEQLRAAMAQAVSEDGLDRADGPHRFRRNIPIFPTVFDNEVSTLCRRFTNNDHHQLEGTLAQRMLLDVGGWLETHPLVEGSSNGQLDLELKQARHRLAAAGCEVPTVETEVRYCWVTDVLQGVVSRSAEHTTTWSDRIDRVLTHRILGTGIFLLVMAVVFQSLYTWAAPLMDFIDAAVHTLSAWVEGALPPGALTSLLADGVIAGVGAVLVFLPQIAILFLFIAFLEDCGYLARAAFLMDRLMSRLGLSGKSFIPLMCSFACAVPGIMATRVIEDRRDRMATMLVAPLMSCSARLPVYVLLIGAFIPPTTYLGGWLSLQGLVLLAMHFVGALVAIPVTWIVKKLILRGESPPFVMELPSYKVPTVRNVILRVWDRVMQFLKDAGTLIFAASIVVWALLYFPRPAEIGQRYAAQISYVKATWQGDAEQLDTALASLKAQRDAEYVEQSLMVRIGRFVEPAVRPLGWDWKIGVGAIASFPAREIIIATLGTIYSLGGELDEQSGSLRDTLHREPWAQEHPIPVALSIMVFFALCAQCAAMLAVIKRETNSWFWPAFAFTYMTVLAYLGALVTYQVGSRIG